MTAGTPSGDNMLTAAFAEAAGAAEATALFQGAGILATA